MKVIIEYKYNENLIVSIYVLKHIRILRINLTNYFLENYNNLLSNKSNIDYKNTLKIIWYELKKIKKNIYIDFIDLRLNLGNKDPSLTAISYGIINSVIPSIICLFDKIIPIRNYHVKITPDFKTNKSSILFYCKINTSFIFIIFNYLNMKRRLKNAKHKSSSN